MPDVYDSSTRSRVMRAVKSRDTTPERVVRSLLHCQGYRFRLHRRDLPGNPDIVFPSRRAVIFVHGCFWHNHDCPRGRRKPRINAEYWENKRQANAARHEKARGELAGMGWRCLVVWECEVKSREELAWRLKRFLGPSRTSISSLKSGR